MKRKKINCEAIVESIAFLIAFATLVIALCAFIPTDTKGEANTGDFNSTPFNEGWTVEVNGDKSVLTLPKDMGLRTGDEIIMTNKLPDDLSDGMSLLFRTSSEDIRIYIDGELRESYASEDFERMSYYLPSAYVVAGIEGVDAGKTIEVRITAKGQSVLNEVRLSHGNNAWFMIIKSNLLIVIIAAIIIIAGLFSVIFYRFLWGRFNIGRSILFLGSVMTAAGIWMLSESKLRQLIFARPSLSSYFSFFSIEIASVFICLYFDEVQQKRYHRRYLLVEGLMLAQIIINVLLNAAGIMELYKSLIFSHIWIGLGIVIILTNVITDIVKKHVNEYSAILRGMFIFTIFAFLELVNFYLVPFRSLGVFMCAGLISLLISTIVQETEKIRMIEVEKTVADESNKAKSAFLANMSHEVRTPINAVLGMNELILRESKESEIREYAGYIDRAGRSLLSIINDILDFSKIESGRMSLIPADYDTALMINDACEMIRERAKEKELEFETVIDPIIPSRLHGDDVRLKQIIVNLLTNAVKYTKKGKIRLEAKLKATGEDYVKLHISVKDTGIGIKPEDIDGLFKSFARVDEYKNRNVEGSGLGLSIVSNLLSMMGSELKLESVYGEGSEFYFDIIQQISDPAPIGDFEDYIRETAVEVRQREYVYAPDARILVIDDRKMNLEVVKGLLKKSGIGVDTAMSGKEGISLMKGKHYDIVFFDHMMPELSGIETYKECIKEGILTEDFPAVMMTANAVVGAKDEYIEAGFADYISKPVSPSELERVLVKYLPKSMVKIVSEKNGKPDERKRPERPAPIPERYLNRDEDAEFTDDDLIDTRSALDYYEGDKKMYAGILKEFIKDESLKEIESFYERKDWKNYAITAHSLKSGAAYMAAYPLSKKAADIEAAIKREDYDYVLNNKDAFIKLYKDTKSVAEKVLNNIW
ncbi:MAG: response regulator [Lachnospiraceae bacterium]|nr:response regulator [Lachnospiraceae bacterium]